MATRIPLVRAQGLAKSAQRGTPSRPAHIALDHTGWRMVSRSLATLRPGGVASFVPECGSAHQRDVAPLYLPPATDGVEGAGRLMGAQDTR
jgi:hypothetical protein